MKKLICLLLLLAMLVSTLAACEIGDTLGSNNNTQSGNGTQSGNNTQNNGTQNGGDHTHTWINWVTEVPATCGTVGIRRGYCACGVTTAEQVPATGVHVWDSWVSDGNGKQTRVCDTCGKSVVRESQFVEVDVSDYKLLYANAQSSDALVTRLRSFADELRAATGKNFKLNKAGSVAVQAGSKEILIGLTDRAESQAAYEEIDGDGYIVRLTADKIVLIGSNNLYTMMAVEYFVDAYLTFDTQSTKLMLCEEVRSKTEATVELSNSANKKTDASAQYTYVYKDGLGMIPSAYLSANYDVTQSTYDELPMAAAKSIVETASTLVKLSQKYFPIGTDATVNEKEVLIGLTSRAESAAALEKITETQYVIAVMGKRVVINAWSNAALEQATDMFKRLLKDAVVQDAEGNKRICLPQDFCYIGEVENEWVTDFPKPEGEGISLYNTMDNNDDSLQYLYRGKGVNRAAYDAYCAQLKSAGYKEYMSIQGYSGQGRNTDSVWRKRSVYRSCYMWIFTSGSSA